MSTHSVGEVSSGDLTWAMRYLGILIIMLLATATATACGGGSDAEQATSAAASTSGAASAIPSQTSPPTADFVEAEDCRADMMPIVDEILLIENTSARVFGLNNDVMSPRAFQRLVARLQRTIDNALLACSRAVEKPMRWAMFKLSLVNADITLCTNGSNSFCGPREIRRNVGAASYAAIRAGAALNALS